MKKYLFFLLISLISGAGNLQAQVAIGSLSAPHPAAVLDLDKSTFQLGLKLSKVVLDADSSVFKLIANPSSQQKTEATGMIVYNADANIMEGEGIYFWDGLQWNPFNKVKPAVVSPSIADCNDKEIPVHTEKEIEKEKN